MCGLCVETRRSSTHMQRGDYLTSLPLAPNRSSKICTKHYRAQERTCCTRSWPEADWKEWEERKTHMRLGTNEGDMGLLWSSVEKHFTFYFYSTAAAGFSPCNPWVFWFTLGDYRATNFHSCFTTHHLLHSWVDVYVTGCNERQCETQGSVFETNHEHLSLCHRSDPSAPFSVSSSLRHYYLCGWWCGGQLVLSLVCMIIIL